MCKYFQFNKVPTLIVYSKLKWETHSGLLNNVTNISFQDNFPVKCIFPILKKHINIFMKCIVWSTDLTTLQKLVKSVLSRTNVKIIFVLCIRNDSKHKKQKSHFQSIYRVTNFNVRRKKILIVAFSFDSHIQRLSIIGYHRTSPANLTNTEHCILWTTRQWITVFTKIWITTMQSI